jgi:hypothetical protein
MAVAIDATGTEALSGASVLTPFNYTGLTVGAGLSNGGIIVPFQADSALAGIVVTWGAQTLSLIASRNTSSGKIAYLYGGVAPTAGNQTLAISWTGGGTHQLMVQADSLTGVNQTGGVTTFPHSVTNGGANSQGTTGAITSAIGNMTVASWVQAGADSFTSTSATQIYVDNGGAVFDGGANRAAGAATVTMTATFSDSSNTWDVVACDILAAAGGAAVFIPRPRRIRTYSIPLQIYR